MMDNLKHLPKPKRSLLQELTVQLSRVRGMAAIVLGGSYASGTQHEAFDLDIGLCYCAARPFSISAIRQVADSVSAQGPAMVTGSYGWGRWVNGGTWIHSPVGPS